VIVSDEDKTKHLYLIFRTAILLKLFLWLVPIFWEPCCITTIRLWLRRTLVLSNVEWTRIKEEL